MCAREFVYAYIIVMSCTRFLKDNVSQCPCHIVSMLLMHGVRSLLSLLLKNGESRSGKKEKLNMTTWYIIINLGVIFISMRARACARLCMCVCARACACMYISLSCCVPNF